MNNKDGLTEVIYKPKAELNLRKKPENCLEKIL